VSELAIWAERALTPERELHRVRLRVGDGRIVELEEGVEAAPSDERYPEATLVPGLVDLQVNGGDGAAFDAAGRDERARATAFHVKAGTTSLLATLVSAPLDRLGPALERLAADVDPAGPVLGIHLEGPFLDPEKGGAHDRQALQDPTPEAVERILRSAGAALRLVTLAPELPGALEAIERFAQAGAVVAAGHTRASLEQMRRAIDRGLSFVTHVGNASDWPSRPVDPERGFRRSEPGVVGTFLLERRLRGSLIADGLHLHPELVRAIVELRGPECVALVSDATAAAGLPPGDYRMGELQARVHAEGYATTGQGLAGSTITLAQALRTSVQKAAIPLRDALRMATATPAQVLGLAGRKGSLQVGGDADLLLLGPDLEVRAVYQRGRRS
jgi:N-acetylglucosamine-6-phosphate deacetylase